MNQAHDHPTPAWLTEVLRASAILGASARVTEVRHLTARLGVAMSSRAGRYGISYEPAGAGPQSLFIKQSRKTKHDFSKHYADELRFYRELARRVPLRIPIAFAVSQPGESYFMVQEDVVASGAEHRLAGVDGAEARNMICDLAEMHGEFWESDSLESWTREAWSRERAVRLSTRVRDTIDAFFLSQRFPTTNESARAMRALHAGLVEHSVHLEGGPRTFIHGDGHIENIMFYDDGSVVWFDWQRPGLSHPAIDLAVSLSLNLASTESSAIDDLLAVYFTRLDARIGRDRARVLNRLAIAAAVSRTTTSHIPFLAELEELSAEDDEIFRWEWERLGRAAIWAAGVLVG